MTPLKFSYNFLFTALFSAAALTCNTTDPPVDKAELLLTLEDVSCTEASITLTTTNLQLPATLELKQDNQTRSIINLVKPDTLLFIDSLLPNQTYKFHSVIQPSNQSSNELSVTTLDTTSHNFTFETWTFGDIGSSVLYDVAVISPDNIWAVGEINIADTSVNGYTTYNAVHWDGSEWQLKKITVNFRGFIITPTLEGIFAFSPTEIWLASGLTIYGDGNNWIPYDVRLITGIDELSFSKAWGSSPDNMYFVGRNGSIAHYNGSQWTRIQSGTNLNINDIWGDYNEKTGEWEILAVGGNILHGTESERVILKIKNNQVEQLNAEGTNWPLISAWFKSNRKYYVIGSGIYEKKFLSDTLWKDNGFDITHYTTYRIRGNGLNDVILVGAFGELLHFNGVTWKSYINQTMLNTGRFYGVNIKENIIIAVGLNNPKAVITIGTRIN
jgi:hypothetical protein